MTLKMLLIRVALAGIGFVLCVTEETVLAWLWRTAARVEAINHHLLRNLSVTQVQLCSRVSVDDCGCCRATHV
jgi:hypothetical protein